MARAFVVFGISIEEGTSFLAMKNDKEEGRG